MQSKVDNSSNNDESMLNLKVKPKNRKIIFYIILAVTLILNIVLFALDFSLFRLHSYLNYVPKYEKENITTLLEKDINDLSDADFNNIYHQTGLTKVGINRLCSNSSLSNKKEEILSYQEALFYKDYNHSFDYFTPFTGKVKLSSSYLGIKNSVVPHPIIPLKEGDIILSSSSFILGFRSGHSMLVTKGSDNPDKSEIINVSIEYDSKEVSGLEFTQRANLMIYRLKDEYLQDFTINDIVDFAKSNGVGVKYNLVPKKGILNSSNCSTTVYNIFNHFGIDIDGNGGSLVTPEDISLSDKLELVQGFGLDLDKRW